MNISFWIECICFTPVLFLVLYFRIAEIGAAADTLSFGEYILETLFLYIVILLFLLPAMLIAMALYNNKEGVHSLIMGAMIVVGYTFITLMTIVIRNQFIPVKTDIVWINYVLDFL